MNTGDVGGPDQAQGRRADPHPAAQGVLDARGRVLVKLNCSSARPRRGHRAASGHEVADGQPAALPIEGYAVEAVVPKARINVLIPELIEAGAPATSSRCRSRRSCRDVGGGRIPTTSGLVDGLDDLRRATGRAGRMICATASRGRADPAVGAGACTSSPRWTGSWTTRPRTPSSTRWRRTSASRAPRDSLTDIGFVRSAIADLQPSAPGLRTSPSEVGMPLSLRPGSGADPQRAPRCRRSSSHPGTIRSSSGARARLAAAIAAGNCRARQAVRGHPDRLHGPG